MAKKHFDLFGIPRKYFRISLANLLTFFMLFSLSAAQESSEGEEVMNMAAALRKGLAYIKKYDEAKTLDIALGVMLVKGNLQWIVNGFKETLGVEKILCTEMKRLIRMCDDVFSDISTHLQNSPSRRDRKFSSLLTYTFRYILAGDLKYGSLNRNNFRLPNFKNCSLISTYFFGGTPDNSDVCILELFDTNCNISSSCLFEEASDIESRGYRTSHRLLYLQLASKLQCRKYQPWILKKSKYMRKSLCEKMLTDVNALYRQNIFLARDLFLENIALCGFEGYVEFWKKKWIKMILKWQNSNGCFGFMYPEHVIQRACNGVTDLNSKMKRDDVVINGICHTHITAVAISALAFLMRVPFHKFLH